VGASEGPARARLVELVAALSLGVDLGFGQPMEHVLRQCMIALRLAERIGLDEAQRSVVYYTALLINVGCHSDAHEQAKWFGDDIGSSSTHWQRMGRSMLWQTGSTARENASHASTSPTVTAITGSAWRGRFSASPAPSVSRPRPFSPGQSTRPPTLASPRIGRESSHARFRPPRRYSLNSADRHDRS
jgi:hypothetical protein